ncbi:MAG: ADP-forming succinate--CoA ligase subunit beta [Actinomycetota bacterium]|nr:MAG: ADP-forming succinate--CoA ligase subunit beta [Actinomycetota bacterium]
MDLFEYQGKQFFAQYGIATSPGDVADTVDHAVDIADSVGYPAVIKAQVQVGGRGKAGGIKIVNNREEAKIQAGNILGMDIKGHLVKRVWVEHASDIEKEYYVSFTLDRSAKLHMAMVSAKGGVEIEDVALTDPEAIVKYHVNPLDGITIAEARDIAVRAGIDKPAIDGVSEILVKLYDAFVKGDADLVEINPLILTPEHKVHALDAKVTLDDAAAFRHPEWEAYRATQEYDGREKLAKELGLNYIGLDGNVGIIANGAGLAMSTLDVVNQVGGQAANFLDLGGGADANTMTSALEVINTDHNVKSVLINIFGGITRCDDIARGIIEALSRVELKDPLVIRLDGTNAAEARKIIEPYVSDKLIVRPTMMDAAQTAVNLANGGDVK